MATTKGPKTNKKATEVEAPTFDHSDVLEEIVNLIKNRQQKGKAGPAVKPAPKGAPAEAEDQIQIWEDDPFLEAVDGSEPVPAEPIPVDLPENGQPSLQTEIVDPRPDPGIFDPTTADFRYWNAESALARGVNFWGPLLPNGTVWSTQQAPMQVHLDEDVDFNAFYARDSGLNFFHGEVSNVQPPVTVFSGESPGVVCHELGHAILDAVKPELFDAMSSEVGAFHEAFGDMSSMLTALQLPSFRDSVLQQTGGRLNANSRLSRLARQLGWAIRVQINPAAVDSDCLRNTSNRFFYHDPNGLPPSGPASQLTSEVHNFSRVFSGAFLDVLAAMFQIGGAGDSDQLEAVSVDAGKLLIEGVRLASVGPGFYAQVAAGMIQADHSLFNGRYRTALTSSFVQRGILSPATAVALARELQGHGGKGFGVTGLAPAKDLHKPSLQFEGDNEGYKKTAQNAPSLPLRPLLTRFGVAIYLHMPAEPNRFGVAPAALTGGTEKTYSPEEDARSYVEDLIQRDRIAYEHATDPIFSLLTTPGEVEPSEKTHRLVNENGRAVLKRNHFDCGLRGCRHGH